MPWTEDKPLLDIPIYFEAESKYQEASTRYVQEVLLRRRNQWMEYGSEPPKETLERWEWDARAAFGGPWQLNEIIGWYRLYAERNAVRVEYWKAEAKRLNRSMVRRRFFMDDVAIFRVRVFGTRASEEIQDDLVESLRSHAKHLRQGRAWVDLSRLEGLGPFVDWAAAVSSVSGD